MSLADTNVTQCLWINWKTQIWNSPRQMWVFDNPPLATFVANHLQKSYVFISIVIKHGKLIKIS